MHLDSVYVGAAQTPIPGKVYMNLDNLYWINFELTQVNQKKIRQKKKKS